MIEALISQRDAVWESIKRYEPLKGSGKDGTKFNAVFRWKETGGEVRFDLSLPPFMPLSDLPAISIRTASGDDKWIEHQGKAQLHRIEIKLWTPCHNQDVPSEYRKWIRRAIHQVPNKENPFLRQASGKLGFNVTFPDFVFMATESKVFKDENGEDQLTWGSACTETTFLIEVPFTDSPASDNDEADS